VIALLEDEMTEQHPSHLNPHHPGLYEIRVQGIIPSSRESWFDGMTISYGDGDQTILRGEVADQSALHGLLNKIRDLNLSLISVK
jgi:hypothetical protein